jgi:porin
MKSKKRSSLPARRPARLSSARLLATALLIASPAVAQESSENPGDTQSGYEDIPEFGGERSTPVQLEKDDAVKDTTFRFDGIQCSLAPYFDFKRRMNEDHGLAFGMDYTGTYFGASDSLGADEAASGNFRLFGSWTVMGRGTQNTGSVVFKVEDRHQIGGSIPVSALGFESGYAGLLGPPFNDRGSMLTNFYWQQRMDEGRLNFVAGFVDTTDYLDIYGLANPWTHFSNLVFTTGSGAMPAPDQGLGAAVGAMLGEQFYVVAGVADANGHPTDPGESIDSFFHEGEYFTHIELGHTTSYEDRYTNNSHLTLWHADERRDAAVPDGWGAAFSVARFFNEEWMPFLRGGFADDGGALLERSLSAGLGYYMQDRGDLLGVGLNWGTPSTDFGPDPDDQYGLELFYRIQLSQNFAVTPDLQWIADPATNPDESSILYLGLRMRLSL